MALDIGRVAVVGAGTMGAQIAAHFANVGIPACLLDRAPGELTPAEAARGWSLVEPEVGNRIVREAFQRAKALKPSPFFQARNAERITLGNMRDHRGMLAEADWVIEAVLERLDVKQGVLAEIEAAVRPGTIVTSNTSGLSITAMSAGRSDSFRRRFCGTHFFNPPRYLHLLELIPTAATDPGLVTELADFRQPRAGEGDRGLQGHALLHREPDRLLCHEHPGPGDAPRRLHRRRGGRDHRGGDAAPSQCHLPAVRPGGAGPHGRRRREPLLGGAGGCVAGGVPHPDFIAAMVERGWRGEKSGQGFYRRVRAPGGSEILALDLDTWEYRPRQRPDFASVAAAKRLPDPGERLRALVNGNDRAAAYAWRVLSETLVYAAARAEEIADDLPRIDDAMRWGWNWGAWSLRAVGCARSGGGGRAARGRGPHRAPELARQALAAGGSFYRREASAVQVLHFDGGWRARPPEAGVLPSVN